MEGLGVGTGVSTVVVASAGAVPTKPWSTEFVSTYVPAMVPVALMLKAPVPVSAAVPAPESLKVVKSPLAERR